MKHLGKLVINPEKVMKNGELNLLRGGDDIWHCLVLCMLNWPDTNQTPFLWDGVAESDVEAKTTAENYYEASLVSR
jgi:hypothetical protein